MHLTRPGGPSVRVYTVQVEHDHEEARRQEHRPHHPGEDAEQRADRTGLQWEHGGSPGSTTAASAGTESQTVTPAWRDAPSTTRPEHANVAKCPFRPACLAFGKDEPSPSGAP